MSTAHEQVEVLLGSRTYPIVVGSDILDGIGDALSGLNLGRQVGVVSDDSVRPIYGDRVADSLRKAGYDVTEAILPSGEAHKTLDAVSTVLDAFLDARFDRQCTVIGLGGGVVGDIAGFAASVLLRGVRLVQVPTTVVAQVDASVGGKTGVDHRRGKNLIGAFHQPSLVYADIATLGTLPRRELRGGLAEVVKHALIRDPELFRHLEEKLASYAAFEATPEEWVGLIATNCRIKAAVVSEDERESGLREILNYGHTAAHAMETLGGFDRYRHGEAVLFGMRVAGALALARDMWTEDDLRRQDSLIDAIAPTDRPADMDVRELLDLMRSDKKVRGGVVRFVLPTRIGDVSLVDDISESEIAEAWSAAICAPPARS